MKVRKFLKIMLICLLICAVIWCLIHRRVIYAWIKGEPIPEMPEWHKKCVKWFLGKVAGESAFCCLQKAVKSRK